jgi:hypothetical protein
MADNSLNLSAKGTALFRAAEQGWLTGQAWAMTHHETTNSPLEKDDVLPMGNSQRAYDINPYDLLFVYTDCQAISVSRDGKRDGVGAKPAFSFFNGMNINRPCSFLGCATTGYISGTGVNAVVSITMSGVVTTDCTSYHAFKDGDLVAWRVPGKNTYDNTISYPFHAKDNESGKLRCVLEPVRNTNKGDTMRIVHYAHRIALNKVTACFNKGDKKDWFGSIITTLRGYDSQSETAQHLTGVVHKEPKNRSGQLHPHRTKDVLARDLWSSLSMLQKKGTPGPGQKGHLSTETALVIAVLSHMATMAACFMAINDDTIHILNADGTSTGKDLQARSQALGELNVNLLFVYTKYVGYIDEHKDLFKKNHIVGLCLKSCPAGAIVNLDIWLGRKE